MSRQRFKLGELAEFGNALRAVLDLEPLYGDEHTRVSRATDEHRFGRRLLYAEKVRPRADGLESRFSW